MNELTNPNQAFLIYQDENGTARVNVRFEGKDVWLNVDQMMELFDASQQDISYYINQIYAEGEQSQERTRKKKKFVSSTRRQPKNAHLGCKGTKLLPHNQRVRLLFAFLYINAA